MPRPSKHDGVLYKRKESEIWWMRYRDKSGQRRFESTGCTDWQEANRKLRERLTDRDQNVLDVVRKGEKLLFQEWAYFLLQNFSQPPNREAKTHEANERAMKHLMNSFSQTADGNHRRWDRVILAIAAAAAGPAPDSRGVH